MDCLHAMQKLRLIHYDSSEQVCVRKLGVVSQLLVRFSPREVCGEEILLEAFEMEAPTGWPYPGVQESMVRVSH